MSKYICTRLIASKNVYFLFMFLSEPAPLEFPILWDASHQEPLARYTHETQAYSLGIKYGDVKQKGGHNWQNLKCNTSGGRYLTHDKCS